ncbi:hypothetical protein Q8A64_15560 [Oxalobacteraceae bacterium R-40]|uniref:Uncharacterized protein n=1 Tax=Keguizhuia sedimenti TaxID=3064264 RepID=A0ABU1BS34_9BURK|nr:hypothetical protein [Oxalobacteraceae bacterium R-40]
MIRYIIPCVLLALGGCATQPETSETVWVVVKSVYSADELGQSFNSSAAKRFADAGFNEKDISAGRLLKVACGLGTDYTWGSYAYLPPGVAVKSGDVVRLRIDEPATDDRPGMNPVVDRVERFNYPGSLQAYRYIPDWKERNLFLNFERIPLAREQERRYIISHGAYVIKCRQNQ